MGITVPEAAFGIAIIYLVISLCCMALLEGISAAFNVRARYLFKRVNGLLYELEIPAIGCPFPDAFDPSEQHALIVIPFIKFPHVASR